jgi:solute carrier family 25 protein 38
MRNVPGVAIYMTCLTQLRSWMATSPYFTSYRRPFPDNPNASVLPKLTNTGNLLAGATTRVAVGLLLNPFSVLKARYEVCYCIYEIQHKPAYVDVRVICTPIKA